MDALTAKGGQFENGMYSWVDADGKHRNQDAAEAIYEENRGEQIVYPEPRYDRLLMFNPDAFPWAPDPGQPGVAHKWMGTFTEKEIRFGFVRIEAGASAPSPRWKSCSSSRARSRPRTASTRRCPPSAPRPVTSRCR
jgi:hypothetical protein